MCLNRIQDDIDVYIAENHQGDSHFQILDRFSHLKGDSAVLSMGLDLPKERRWNQAVTIRKLEKYQADVTTDYFGLPMRLKVPIAALIDPKVTGTTYYSMKCEPEDPNFSVSMDLIE